VRFRAPRYVDVNGDNVIDAKDRTNLGNPIPKAMGFNLQMNYKSLDLSIYFCIRRK
jgi:hypothetical protein